MTPRGGTEILYGNFRKYVDPEIADRINLLVSGCRLGNLSSDKPNVLWQHLDTDQDAAQCLRDSSIVDRLQCIVFVSQWQMEKYIKEFNIPADKCRVLLNAIEPVEYRERSKGGKLKLIYTSTPWRGLEVLLRSFKLLDRSDVELYVYSSTVIYGVDFMKNSFDWLFNQCRAAPGVHYMGYATNKAVIRSLGSAHIFSYPSTFAETSCLAAIEAGAAGCQLVVTDLGALPETCGSWANYVDCNVNGLAERFAQKLNTVIDDYWVNYGSLVEQGKYFNTRYSWTNRAVEWVELIDQLCAK